MTPTIKNWWRANENRKRLYFAAGSYLRADGSIGEEHKVGAAGVSDGRKQCLAAGFCADRREDCKDGAGEIDGWQIHLLLIPRYEKAETDAEGTEDAAAGTQRLHLFYENAAA